MNGRQCLTQSERLADMSDNNKTNVPRHVAIILDGNGRWAKKRFLPRAAGHSAGAKTVEDVCEWAWDLGIKYLTVYAFSTENWKRSEDEVKTLMNLLRDYLKNCLIRSCITSGNVKRKKQRTSPNSKFIVTIIYHRGEYTHLQT